VGPGSVEFDIVVEQASKHKQKDLLWGKVCAVSQFDIKPVVAIP